MQEDVEQRSVTLIISTAKLTGRALKAAITKFLAYQKEAMARASPDVQPKGKQTVKELVHRPAGPRPQARRDRPDLHQGRLYHLYPIDIYYSGIGIINAPSAEEYEEMFQERLKQKHSEKEKTA